MSSSEFNPSNDSFALDRDQDDYLHPPQAQSTPTIMPTNQSGTNQLEIDDLYEIVN